MATGDGQIEFIIGDLVDFSEREIRALAVNVDANLRANPPQGTPVDTGWAAANWVPSIDAPKILADKRDPTPADIAAMRQAGEAGLNDVLSWKLADGPIFVTNNVVYITRLNEGHGRAPQSPPGFVQTALEQAVLDTALQAMDERSSRGLRGRAGR